MKENNRLEKCVADMESTSTINSADIGSMIDIKIKYLLIIWTDSMPVSFSNVQSRFLIILGKYLHPPLVNFIKTIVGLGPLRAKSGVSLSKTRLKVSKGAKIRNRYNQVPHLIQSSTTPDNETCVSMCCS